jgi:hypothetical protein
MVSCPTHGLSTITWAEFQKRRAWQEQMRHIPVQPTQPPQPPEPRPPPQPWSLGTTVFAGVVVFIVGVLASYPFASSVETSGAVGLSVWVVGAVLIAVGRWHARRGADRARGRR